MAATTDGPVHRRILYRLTWLAAALSLGHHLDHLTRGNAVGWPLTDQVNAFTISLVVWALPPAGRDRCCLSWPAGPGSTRGCRAFTTEADPVQTLLAVARAHAVYCRRDIARVLVTLRVEFTGQDHPIGRAITEVVDRLLANCTELIAAGRTSGAIPPGPPPRDAASALLAALESVPIQLAGRAPHDTELAERVVRGLLGLPPQAVPTPMEVHE
jgi:hypothetical protein